MTGKLALSIRSYTRQQQSHRHNHCQLVLPIQGQIDIDINGDKKTIGAKRLAIISTNETHSFSAHEQARFLVVDLPSFPTNITTLNRHYLNISDAFYAFVLYAEQQLSQANFTDVELEVSQLFFQLLATQSFQRNIDPRIEQTLTYMEQHLTDENPLSMLAGIACLSLSQFKHLFRQQMDMSPHQYLTKIRMEKAKALLCYTDYPVGLIAE